MCGRFNVIDNPDLQQLLEDLGIDLSLNTAINIAPTETIAVIRGDDAAARELTPMRWWLTPSWAPEISTRYSMFNAKSETLATSRAFKKPYATQRGIVPASSFIEWKTEHGRKQPYLIKAREGALALAAIWDRWTRDGDEMLSCALVTTSAADSFMDIHHRMPVMLDQAGMTDWLNNSTPSERLEECFESRLRTEINVSPINPGINNARNKDLTLLEATGPTKSFSP